MIQHVLSYAVALAWTVCASVPYVPAGTDWSSPLVWLFLLYCPWPFPVSARPCTVQDVPARLIAITTRGMLT